MDSAPSIQRKARSRERRPEARRTILEATERLLLDRGVEGVSMRAVSARSGFSAPTIYHHFGDKNGLIDALLEERFREVLTVMREVPRGGDAAAYLSEVARSFVRFALANPGHYRLLSGPRRENADLLPSNEAARDLVKHALEELARAGELGTGDVEAAFQITWAVLHGLISLHLTRPDYPFAENLVDMAIEMVEAGLLRRKAARS